MVFKLCESAGKRWHRIAGFKRLGEVITGVKFVDGIASSNNDQDARGVVCGKVVKTAILVNG